MDLSKQAFLVVIDGSEPAEWQPWDTKFEKLSEQIDIANLKLPSSYHHMEEYRLRLLLESRENFSKRENWSRVVGAVIDGRTPENSAKIKEAFDLLCAKLQASNDGLFRTYGFYAAVVLPPNVTPEHTDFWHSLKLKAIDLLGERVEVQPVTEEAHIRFVLPDFNRRLIFAIVKQRRSNG